MEIQQALRDARVLLASKDFSDMEVDKAEEAATKMADPARAREDANALRGVAAILRDEEDSYATNKGRFEALLSKTHKVRIIEREDL